uniref:Uncharacterized protein n=1 Tax=Mucochytrium quahogii TaxID=96639 RepID=A0A7S2SBD3_9STRA
MAEKNTLEEIDKTAQQAGPEEDSGENEEIGLAPVSVAGLFRYYSGNDFALVVLGTVGGLVNGASMPVFSILLGNLYNEMQGPDVDIMDVGTKYSLWLVYLAIVTFVFSTIQMGCFTLTSEKLVIRIRKEYLQSVLRQDISWFDSRKNGELSAKLAENTVLVRDGVGTKLGSLVHTFGQFAAGFVIAFIYNWKMALVMAATSPLMGIAGHFMAMAMSNAGKVEMEAYAAAGGVAEEGFGMIRTVASLGLEKRLTETYNRLLQNAERFGRKKHRALGLGMGFSLLIYFLIIGVAFWFGGFLVKTSREDAASSHPPLGSADSRCNLTTYITPATGIELGCPSYGFPYTFNSMADVCACSLCNCGCYFTDDCVLGGDIMVVFFAGLVGSFAIGLATPSISALITARVAAAQLFAVIDRVPEIVDRGSSGEKPESIQGKIELRDVEFAYPSRPDAPIFTKLNLTLNPGETVALVGGSGSGKSTVTQLIQRFYDPLSGSVLIDGRDIKSLDLPWLRDQIALVGQEPVLFATSIEDNIRYGCRDGQTVTREDVEQAVRSANAYEFVEAFPDGLDTRIGDHGGLSGGQKQRVAIARAIIRDPSILILDEATSALDNTSERVVQSALDDLMKQKKRTTLVIAHRLSTVRHADRIVVMGDHGVVEEGTHDELLQIPNGHYKALVQAAQHSSTPQHTLDTDASLDVAGTSSSHVDPAAVVHVEGQDSTSTKQSVPFSRLFKYCMDEKWSFVPAFLGSIVMGAFPPVLGVLIANISTVYYLPTLDMMVDKVNNFTLAFVYCAVVVGLAQFLQLFFFGRIGESMTLKIRRELFQNILRQDITFFDKTSTGALSGQLSSDAALVKASIADRFGLIVQIFSTLVVGLVIAMIYGWKLGLVMMFLLPALVFSGMYEMFAMKGYAQEDEEALRGAASVLTESINGIRTVTAFALRNKVITLYDECLAAPSKLALKRGLTGGVCYGASTGVMYLVFAVGFYYGSYLMTHDQMSFDDFTKVFFTILEMGIEMGLAMAMASDIARGSAAVDSVFAVLDRESAVDPFDETGMKEENQTCGDIVFSNVSFAYPTRRNAMVLDNFSLTIKHNSTVALVGQSGSGKSTMINFLERFYDPLTGVVQYHGMNVKNINTKWLREQIGFVQQEPQLFDTTIFENIAYGLPESSVPVTQEQVEEAARAANAHEFIMSFPDAYQTMCGRGGKKLSGGQKQRVCLARCIIRNPKLLLLDEATSALDNTSERVVQTAIDKMMEDRSRTTIVIAHRLSTIQNADMICVVDHGSIVEMGSHQQLMANLEGVYYKMYNK